MSLKNLNPVTPIADADLPGSITRDAEYIAADKAHVDALDPHTQYANQSRGDARYFRGRSQVHTLDPPVIGPGELYKIFYTFVGAKTGDFCLVSPINVNMYAVALWPFMFAAIVEQADTVAVYIRNDFSAAIDLGSFQFRVIVINF